MQVIYCNGAVFPRKDSDPDALKELGAAVDRWVRRNIVEDSVHLPPGGNPEIVEWSEEIFQEGLERLGIPPDSPRIERSADALSCFRLLQWVDWPAIDALKSGEFPLPGFLATTAVAQAPQLKPDFSGRRFSEDEWREVVGNPDNFFAAKLSEEDKQRLKKMLGPNATNRVVPFITARDDPRVTRAILLDSLFADIPVELVEDVLLDGRSWNIPD